MILPAKVLIVEDHPLVRLGLSHSLDRHPRLEMCGEADTECEALQLIEEVKPDALIVDLTLRGGTGLSLIKRLRRRRSDIAVIVSSMHDSSVYEERSLLAGATAYISKDRGIEQLMRAVEQATIKLDPKGRAEHEGQTPCADGHHGGNTESGDEPVDRLTDRELEIFRLFGKGKSTRQIATSLHRSVKTVEAFRVKIKKKLSLSTSEELVRDAVRWVYENDAA